MNTRCIELACGDVRRPFHFREHSAGDIGVIRQVFSEQQYDLGQRIHVTALNSYARELVASGKTPLILDCGANIGASAIHWAFTFPASRVVAVEPHPANFQLLTLNTQGLAVTNIQAAIAARPGVLNLIDPGGGDWAFRTTDHAPEGSLPVEARTPPEVLAPFRAEHAPLVCKIDIEGAEAELFSAANSWANEFAMIVIELHDWMLPGGRTSRPFLSWLSEGDFEVLQRGENLFCFNLSILEAHVRRTIAGADGTPGP